MAGRPHTMKESLMESDDVKPKDKTSTVLDAERMENSGKTPPYLLTVPTALMKFSGASKKKKKEPPAPKKPEKSKAAREEVEKPLGCSCCVFRCCQRFNNVRYFMVFFCLLAVAQGISFGLTTLSSGNFQRNHDISSNEKLIMSVSYDLSSGLIAAFVGFYGMGGNRAKWIAASAFLIGFGSFLMAFPFLGSEHIHLEEETEDMCDLKKRNIHCPESGKYEKKYLLLFILEQILQGIAAMPLYILGITYLDDSVPTHLSGMYLGIADSSSVLGYGLGYTLGTPLLKTLENNTSETTHIGDASNQVWKKIWSFDFIVPTLIAWSTLIPLLCFPRNLPGTTKLQTWKRRQANPLTNKYKDLTFGPNVKDFCYAVWILIKNPVFICQSLCKAAESLVLIGASEFLPIYLENQFLLTHKLSAILTGIILVPGAALGFLLGGIIVSQLRMSCKALMRFIMVTSSISLIFVGCLIFVHCDSTPVAGINENYDGTGQLGNLTAPCNAQCGCSSSLYFPICGRDDIEYFSPCFAGCVLVKNIHDIKAYYYCSCINSGLTVADEDRDFIDARAGKCDMNCYTLPLFFSFMLSAIIFSSFSGVPLNLIIFRVTPEKLHSLALGVSYVILRLFGTVPGPILFKLLGENSCTFREVNTCRKEGHCWIYNKTKMAYLLIGICFFYKAFTIFLSAIGFYIYDYLTRENTDVQPAPLNNVKPKTVQKNKF